MNPSWLREYFSVNTAQNGKRIVTHEGRWWLLDFRENTAQPLDPLFRDTGWNVSNLSKALNMQCRTFTRIAEKSIGINAKLWLRQLRAVTACHMIRETGRIESVSKKLGFRYESDFSREFRKMVGVNPSDYLRKEISKSFLSASNASRRHG